MGTRLFGWCLPFMGLDQHQACFATNKNDDGSIRECPCPCHTDWDSFAKDFGKPVLTKKKKDKK